MLGPRLDAQGGISSVARAWLNAAAMKSTTENPINIDYFSTVSTDTRRKKAAVVAWRQARFVARLARGWRPDIAHIHTGYYVSFYRKMAYFEQTVAAGIPTLVHIHAPDMESFHDAAPLHKRAIQRMFSRAARVVVLSNNMESMVRKWMGDQAKIKVIYNPVDLDLYRPSPASNERPPTVLFMGKVGERKGTWDLVSTIPDVLKKIPNAQFRFGGDGEVEQLEREIKRLGVEQNAKVLGWVDGKSKLEQFAQASVYCLPSYNEGLPMSILEAMGAGLPVVSTPIAGIPEAVRDGETGSLAQPGDIPGLTHALIELLGNPQMREAYGKAGRKRAETHFEVNGIVQQVRDLWACVLQER